MAPREPTSSLSADCSAPYDNAEELWHEHGFTMMELDPHEPVERRSVYRRQSFVQTFVTSNGPPQIVLLILLLALGFGSTIGVVPAVVTDRYARLHHGYADDNDCSFYDTDEKPAACLAGSADGQNAAALASLVSNGLTFITSSLVGSISDEHGRRGECYEGLLCTCVLFINTCRLKGLSFFGFTRHSHSWNLFGFVQSTLSCSITN